MTVDILNAALLAIIALLLVALLLQGRQRKVKVEPVKLTGSTKADAHHQHQMAPKDVREQLAAAQARVHELEPLAAKAAEKNAQNIALLQGIATTLDSLPSQENLAAGYAAALATLRDNITTATQAQQ